MKKSSYSSNQNNKKFWLIPLAIVLFVILGVGGYFGYNKWQENRAAQRRQTQAEELAENYLAALRTFNMEEFTSLLSESSVEASSYTREEIRERYETIFSGIGASNIQETASELRLDEESDQYEFDYTVSMETSLGTLENITYSTTFTEDDDVMHANWDTNLIFPEMEEGDTVGLTYDEGQRGSINDRNGNMLAGNGNAWEAGMYPAALGEGDTRTERMSAISDTFGTEISVLERLLDQSWVTEESFVPFTVVEEGDTPEVAGVMYQQTIARIYPLKEAAAHLTGYVGEVTAEDIESKPALQSGDIVGKSGLEAAFDDRLRGTKGGQITINTADGETKTVLLESEKQDGENIRLTIDMNLQRSIFEQLQGEPGAAVVMAPDSGELLVAASSPSYDPQLFTRGISNDQYQAYSNDTNSPFLARYAARYAPGSTFKILTSMIGLDSGVLIPDETQTIEGLDWQLKAGSFESHEITRVSDAITEVDLQAALTYSDNIYFAREALEMGEEMYVNGLSQFPFGANMNLPFSMQPAQISNDGTLSSNALLADTAYGQGELLMSPIHQITFYSSVVNEGAMTFPTLLLEDEETNQITPVSAESAELVKTNLVEAVEDSNGTAHPFASLPFSVGAKTGTAEISQNGENVTNGFVYAFDAEDDDFTFLGFLEGQSSGDVVERFLPVLSELNKTE